MSTAQDIQTLLRFLSQEAKLPLVQAMGKVKQLQQAGIITPNDIAKSDLGNITSIFEDDKVAKQVLRAAKRVSKKRASDEVPHPSPVKKTRVSYGEPLSPAELEKSLELPEPCLDEDKLSQATIYTNRAPLVLAFAVTLLKYTMPEQPLSSRLSLAQSVVSANSRTKAVSLGLESGPSAEDEGWGEGQPTIKIMGREVKVMKRWGYQWEAMDAGGMSQRTMSEEEDPNDYPALWGVDLEALKKSNRPVKPGLTTASSASLPIYTAQSARSYLLKSFETSAPNVKKDANTTTKPKSASAALAEKENNLSLLLGALDLLMRSWSPTLSKDDLDKRVWSWYMRVRPAVESGVAGWGGKGDVKLADILSLRRGAAA